MKATHEPMLRVLAPGLNTTLQDLGRPGYQHLGIPVSGALDTVSLRAANALVGNAPEIALGDEDDLLALQRGLAVEAVLLGLGGGTAETQERSQGEMGKAMRHGQGRVLRSRGLSTGPQGRPEVTGRYSQFP